MSSEPEQLLRRIEDLEQQVNALGAAAAYVYIALLSIPSEIRRKDPDFANSEDKIKAALDSFYSTARGGGV